MSQTRFRRATLDAVLFEPGSWFALDSSNRRVPGVSPASLEAGLALLGRAGVATIVGRTRPGVLVVDVDLADVVGDAAAEQVVAWCTRHGVWWLVRPSGGGRGRCHVFTAGADEAQLRDEVARLRRAFDVSTSAIDVRRQVRPLSAPHRLGSNPAPYGDLQHALAGFPAESLADEQIADDRRALLANVSRIPATAGPRRRRDLPAEWSAYFARGVTPVVGGHDHTGSTIEAIATGWLVRTGHTVAQAWEIIKTAHPDAMGKAKRNWHRWLGVWNRAVRDVDAYQAAQDPDENVAQAVHAARVQMHEQILWIIPARRRTAVVLVAHALLDRAHRTNRLRVPCPQRDLVLDTGLTDRAVISAALQDLDGRLGYLHTDVYDPAHPDASSYEFTIALQTNNVTTDRAVSQTPPPRFHTPLPRGVWGEGVPRACHTLWRVLSLSEEPLTLWGVCQMAGLCPRRGEGSSARQRRTARELLRHLETAGLARCSPQGTWTASEDLDPGVESVATVAYAELHQRVQEERAAHRAGSRSAWNVQRAAALKANRAREQEWWDGLDPTERGERSRRYRSTFARLSVLQQEDVKAGWVARRQRAGVDERARYVAWSRAQPEDRWEAESHRRAAEFAALPPPLQVASVQAWERHRTRHGLPKAGVRRPRAELRAGTPDTGASRDARFLQQAADRRLPVDVEQLRIPS